MTLSFIVVSLRLSRKDSHPRLVLFSFLFYQRPEGVKKFRWWFGCSAFADHVLEFRLKLKCVRAVGTVTQMHPDPGLLEERDLLVEVLVDVLHRVVATATHWRCLLYTSPSPRDGLLSRMP